LQRTVTRILIADDHPLMRKGVKEILEEQPDMVVKGQAANGRQVLELLRKEQWDVVIMDIGLPGRNGLEILRDIKHQHPKVPVVMLTVHTENEFALRAFKAGAAGYLTKETALEELVRAVRKVIAGGRYFSSSFSDKLACNFLDGGNPTGARATLSIREQQVMEMMIAAKSQVAIARELSVSPKTVSSYRSRILKKLGLTKTAELIQYVGKLL
jgi:DNA-binding NarL/FixJ family response regulator